MFERLGWIVEIVNMILCLHCLYGQKVRSKLVTGILIAFHWSVMQVVELSMASKINIALVYVAILVYAMYEFNDGVKNAIWVIVLNIIIVGLMEFAASIPWILLEIAELTDAMTFVIHLEVLVLLIVCRRWIHKLFLLTIGRNIIIMAVNAMMLLYLLKLFIQSRVIYTVSTEQYVFVLVFGVLICVLSYLWQKEREKRQTKELELKIHDLYETSFRELLDTIRSKQHDFYNHIQTIYVQHYTIHTYDELVAEQKKYCEEIYYDNRYYSLLNSQSHVVAGFLYGKFIEADKKDIRVEYSVNLHRTFLKLPEYIMIEVVGILWDNAVDYVLLLGNKRLYLKIEESEDALLIIVRNPVCDVSYEDVSRFFQKGYSTKEKHIGMGLSKIKDYAKKYQLDISVRISKQENHDWLEISIRG